MPIDVWTKSTWQFRIWSRYLFLWLYLVRWGQGDLTPGLVHSTSTEGQHLVLENPTHITIRFILRFYFKHWFCLIWDRKGSVWPCIALKLNLSARGDPWKPFRPWNLQEHNLLCGKLPKIKRPWPGPNLGPNWVINKKLVNIWEKKNKCHEGFVLTGTGQVIVVWILMIL